MSKPNSRFSTLNVFSKFGSSSGGASGKSDRSKPPPLPPKDNHDISNYYLTSNRSLASLASSAEPSSQPSTPLSPYHQFNSGGGVGGGIGVGDGTNAKTLPGPSLSAVSLLSSTHSAAVPTNVSASGGISSASYNNKGLKKEKSGFFKFVKKSPKSPMTNSSANANANAGGARSSSGSAALEELPQTPPVQTNDEGITLPWNFQHNIHVDEGYNGLPPSWSASLAEAGFTEEEIAAIHARRNAARSPGAQFLYTERPNSPNINDNNADNTNDNAVAPKANSPTPPPPLHSSSSGAAVASAVPRQTVAHPSPRTTSLGVRGPQETPPSVRLPIPQRQMSAGSVKGSGSSTYRIVPNRQLSTDSFGTVTSSNEIAGVGSEQHHQQLQYAGYSSHNGNGNNVNGTGPSGRSGSVRSAGSGSQHGVTSAQNRTGGGTMRGETPPPAYPAPLKAGGFPADQKVVSSSSSASADVRSASPRGSQAQLRGRERTHSGEDASPSSSSSSLVHHQHLRPQQQQQHSPASSSGHSHTSGNKRLTIQPPPRLSLYGSDLSSWTNSIISSIPSELSVSSSSLGGVGVGVLLSPDSVDTGRETGLATTRTMEEGSSTFAKAQEKGPPLPQSGTSFLMHAPSPSQAVPPALVSAGVGNTVGAGRPVAAPSRPVPPAPPAPKSKPKVPVNTGVGPSSWVSKSTSASNPSSSSLSKRTQKPVPSIAIKEFENDPRMSMSSAKTPLWNEILGMVNQTSPGSSGPYTPALSEYSSPTLASSLRLQQQQNGQKRPPSPGYDVSEYYLSAAKGAVNKNRESNTSTMSDATIVKDASVATRAVANVVGHNARESAILLRDRKLTEYEEELDQSLDQSLLKASKKKGSGGSVSPPCTAGSSTSARSDFSSASSPVLGSPMSTRFFGEGSASGSGSSGSQFVDQQGSTSVSDGEEELDLAYLDPSPSSASGKSTFVTEVVKGVEEDEEEYEGEEEYEEEDTLGHIRPSVEAQTSSALSPLPCASPPPYPGWLSEVVAPLDKYIDRSRDPRQHYADLREIAEGESGSVFAARVIDETSVKLTPAARTVANGGFVAIKNVPILPSGSPKLVDLRTELGLMKGLANENILGMDALFVDLVEDSLWIRMELMERSLADVVGLVAEGLAVQERMIARFVSDALLAFEFLEEQRIAHRDVRSDNFLINHEGTMKLTDFSNAVQVTPDDLKFSDNVGVIYWQAPEIRAGPYDAMKVDIWSLGATVWEMAEAEPPFTNAEDESEIGHSWPPISKPEIYSRSFHNFLTQCSKPAASRPRPADLMNTSFVRNACGRPVIIQLLSQCRAIEERMLQEGDSQDSIINS